MGNQSRNVVPKKKTAVKVSHAEMRSRKYTKKNVLDSLVDNEPLLMIILKASNT